MNRRLAVDVAACEAAACLGLSARRLAEDSNLRKALSRGPATHTITRCALRSPAPFHASEMTHPNG
jgi:hypothetical protein